MVGCEVDDVRIQRFRQDSKKMGIKRFYFKRLFHSDEVLMYLLFEELELTAREMPGWKKMIKNVTLYDAAQ